MAVSGEFCSCFVRVVPGARRWLVALPLLLGLLLGGLVLAPPRAAAAVPYQGIYVIIDPYNAGAIAELKSAAATPCTGQVVATTPFCTATNGIFMRIPWCGFQLYHQRNPLGGYYPSCHYSVAFSGGGGSAGVETPFGDQASPCLGSFDTCTGAQGSILGQDLRYIKQINAKRVAFGLKPLLLSVGLFAGQGTPETVLDAVGSLDVTTTTNVTLSPGSFVCMRLPLAWTAPFLADYDAAFDQLLAYIKAMGTGGSTLTMVKVGGINAFDMETEMPGAGTFYQPPLDPGPGGPGTKLQCPLTEDDAQAWFGAYGATPVAGRNFSQANESAFAAILGHEWATIANDGYTGVTLSVATTNGSNFADVDCGPSGTTACFAGLPANGDYSIWYFDRYINDLFNQGLAYHQAAAAYQAARKATFSLAASQLAVDSTALTTTPYVSLQQTPCNLNNVVTSHAPSFTLDGNNYNLLGSGTTLGYQTSPNQGSLCTLGQYGPMLQNGVADGGLFLEIETDAAFTDIAACQPQLASELKKVLAAVPPTVCKY